MSNDYLNEYQKNLYKHALDYYNQQKYLTAEGYFIEFFHSLNAKAFDKPKSENETQIEHLRKTESTPLHILKKLVFPNATQHEEYKNISTPLLFQEDEDESLETKEHKEPIEIEVNTITGIEEPNEENAYFATPFTTTEVSNDTYVTIHQNNYIINASICYARTCLYIASEMQIETSAYLETAKKQINQAIKNYPKSATILPDNYVLHSETENTTLPPSTTETTTLQQNNTNETLSELHHLRAIISYEQASESKYFSEMENSLFEAIEDCKKAIQLSPRNARYYLDIASCYLFLNEQLSQDDWLNDAKRYYTAAIEICPDLHIINDAAEREKIFNLLADNNAEANVQLTNILLKNKNYAEAYSTNTNTLNQHLIHKDTYKKRTFIHYRLFQKLAAIRDQRSTKIISFFDPEQLIKLNNKIEKCKHKIKKHFILSLTHGSYFTLNELKEEIELTSALKEFSDSAATTTEITAIMAAQRTLIHHTLIQNTNDETLKNNYKNAIISEMDTVLSSQLTQDSILTYLSITAEILPYYNTFETISITSISEQFITREGIESLVNIYKKYALIYSKHLSNDKDNEFISNIIQELLRYILLHDPSSIPNYIASHPELFPIYDIINEAKYSEHAEDSDHKAQALTQHALTLFQLKLKHPEMFSEEMEDKILDDLQETILCDEVYALRHMQTNPELQALYQRAYINLGNTHNQSHNTDKDITYYTEAFNIFLSYDIKPDSSSFRALLDNLQETTPFACIQLGNIERNNGNLKNAIEHYNKAISLRDNLELNDGNVDVYFERALAYHLKENLSNSDTPTKLNKDVTDDLINALETNPTAAFEAYDKYAPLHLYYFNALITLINRFIEEEDYEKALRYFKSTYNLPMNNIPDDASKNSILIKLYFYEALFYTLIPNNTQDQHKKKQIIRQIRYVIQHEPLQAIQHYTEYPILRDLYLKAYLRENEFLSFYIDNDNDNNNENRTKDITELTDNIKTLTLHFPDHMPDYIASYKQLYPYYINACRTIRDSSELDTKRKISIAFQTLFVYAKLLCQPLKAKDVEMLRTMSTKTAEYIIMMSLTLPENESYTFPEKFHELLADAAIASGNIKLDQKNRPNEAKKYYNMALEISPTNFNAYIQRARSYQRSLENFEYSVDLKINLSTETYNNIILTKKNAIIADLLKALNYNSSETHETCMRHISLRSFYTEALMQAINYYIEEHDNKQDNDSQHKIATHLTYLIQLDPLFALEQCENTPHLRLFYKEAYFQLACALKNNAKTLSDALDYIDIALKLEDKEHIKLYKERIDIHLNLMKRCCYDDKIEYKNKILIDMMHLLKEDTIYTHEQYSTDPILSSIYQEARLTLNAAMIEYYNNTPVLFHYDKNTHYFLPEIQYTLFQQNNPTISIVEEKEEPTLENSSSTP